MGDLRNKWRKYEREAKMDRDRAEQDARDAERARLYPPPRCLCGLTWHQTKLWQIWDPRPGAVRCKACMTPDQADLVDGLDPDYPWRMCNLYSMTKGPQAIRDLVKTIRDLTGNLEPLPAIFPNRMAPIVRIGADGQRELLMARWGFPPPNIPGQKPRNPYLTNIRNTSSRYWSGYLKKVEHRCLVPATSFAEPDNNQGPKSIWTWFAQDETRPLLFFPGIWREWEGDRGTKAAPDVGNHLVFSFLTTDASHDVAPVHSDATPVCLFTEDEREMWMNAPVEMALSLQRPPAPGSLKIVATGVKQDG